MVNDMLSASNSGPLESDRRKSRRFRTLSRVVRIGDCNREGFGQCRDLSDGGMRLALAMPVERGQLLYVDFSSDLSLQARVVWVNGNECGVAFEEPVNAMALLNDAVDQLHAKHRRQDNSDYSPIVSKDTTSGAVKFTPGLRVKLRLEHGTERAALVHRTKNRIAALVLLDPFAVDDVT